MEWLDRVVGFVHEIFNETTVIDCLVLFHGTLDSDSFFVDDDHTEHAHVRVDAIQRFFNFLWRCHADAASAVIVLSVVSLDLLTLF